MSDSEEDPLDAFMAANDAALMVSAEPDAKRARRAVAGCDDAADGGADFVQAATAASIAAAAAAAAGGDSDDEIRAAGAATAVVAGPPPRADPFAALAAAAASADGWPAFDKCFYTPTECAIDDATAGARRAAAPAPAAAFAALGLPPRLLAALVKLVGDPLPYPTPVQAQAVPAALAGRDVLALAPTGSGKTVAFLIPLIVHVINQPAISPGDGPVALVLTPTRELAEQVHTTLRALAVGQRMATLLACGGYSRFDQLQALRRGVDAAVGTPGRLADLATDRKGGLLFNRLTFVVLDEVDRMLDAGSFRDQTLALTRAVRPDAQALFFSATLPRAAAALASSRLADPVRVTVGAPGAAADGVKQMAAVVADSDKHSWLAAHLPAMVDDGAVLVFCATKARVEAVTERLCAGGCKARALHGDMPQPERAAALASLAGATHVLVATDVAARGLDLAIATVVCADAPTRKGGGANAHVHRLGRTGRGGGAGTAWTLVDPGDAIGAGLVADAMVAAGQEVPAELARVAAVAAVRRGGGGGGRRGGRGGRGRAPDAPGVGFDRPSSRAPGGFVSAGVLAGGAPTGVTVSAPRAPRPPPPPPPPAPPPPADAAAVSAAVAAARAIAARIAAKHGSGGGA